MKKWFRLTACVLVFMFCMVSTGHAVTRDMIIHKVKRAAELIQNVGLKNAVKAIENLDGQFVWNDRVNYVFVMDIKGRTLGHPFRPQDKKRPTMLGIADKKGKRFIDEFVRVAKTDPGMGWVNYSWPMPGQIDPTIKSTFIYRVPGTDYYVGSGLYVVKPGHYY